VASSLLIIAPTMSAPFSPKEVRRRAEVWGGGRDGQTSSYRWWFEPCTRDRSCTSVIYFGDRLPVQLVARDALTPKKEHVVVHIIFCAYFQTNEIHM
jgi:hypothetical protein